MRIKELQEAIKGWKHAGSDLMKHRAQKAAAGHSAKLIKVKKDGTESKMHDATSTYPTEQQARDQHAYWVKVNPGRLIQHNLYVDNQFVEKLSSDSQHKLKETATGGTTSSGSVASVANPFGIVMRQPSLFGYVPNQPSKTKKKVKRSK
jgi:hypothetical protein